jgi:hypothetical protein
MTVPHPLSLDDSQLKVVLDHARQIPTLWRSRWLSLVADQLIAIDVITDGAVLTAIKRVDKQIGVAA